MNLIKSDSIGILASSLCMIHCVATPFIFVAYTCCSSESPAWWQAFDIFFLVISLIAVYFSSKDIANKFIISAMWLSWMSLGIILLNDIYLWYEIDHSAIYVPAAMLIILHIYNLKYCQSSGETCCAKTE